jgi:hypothetical protein
MEREVDHRTVDGPALVPASTITATHWNNLLLRTDDRGPRCLTIRHGARPNGGNRVDCERLRRRKPYNEYLHGGSWQVSRGPAPARATAARCGASARHPGDRSALTHTTTSDDVTYQRAAASIPTRGLACSYTLAPRFFHKTFTFAPNFHTRFPDTERTRAGIGSGNGGPILKRSRATGDSVRTDGMWLLNATIVALGVM